MAPLTVYFSKPNESTMARLLRATFGDGFVCATEHLIINATSYNAPQHLNQFVVPCNEPGEQAVVQCFAQRVLHLVCRTSGQFCNEHVMLKIGRASCRARR